MKFLPREEKFFTLFADQVKIISEASQILVDAAKAGNSHLTAAANRIMSLEQKGDEIIHEILTRLNQTFITPLDPEDIHSLSSHLDDVLDGIEDSVHRMVSYKLEPIPPAAIRLCEIINDCSASLTKAIHALNTDKKILEHCIEINRLEDEADRLGRIAIAELFEKEKDPIQLIKLKELLEFLEQTTDYCEDVADALQNIVVKNS
jgi:predicted phosphate transport protein (TIGR00153 family)